MNHSFTLTVDHRLTDDELDRLFEAGGDDTAPERTADGQTLIHFDREAPNLGQAVASALGTLTAAGLTVIGITAPDPAEVA